MVTNARSPGARCYGFVTMSTAEEATKCVNHLHKTELHGKMISVEKVRARGLLARGCCVGIRSCANACRAWLLQAKNEPTGKKTSDKRDGEGKKEKSSNSDR